MSKYNLKPNQRYAVFKVFNGRCQWCKEPVDFKSFHVDHILPEDLLNDVDLLKKVISSYSVNDNFEINGYENWVPSHGYCNQYKADAIYQGLGIIQTMLDASQKNKLTAQIIQLKLDREPNKAFLMTQVQAAIETNLLNIEELTNSILDQQFMESDDKELNEIIGALDKKIAYQSQIMVAGIFNLLKEHTSQIVSELQTKLGPQWQGSHEWGYGIDPDDGDYHFSCPILNAANKKMSLLIATIAHFDSKKFTITFKAHTHNEMGRKIIGRIEQDVDKIDWTTIRSYIREIYINRLKEKAEM